MASLNDVIIIVFECCWLVNEFHKTITHLVWLISRTLARSQQEMGEARSELANNNCWFINGDESDARFNWPLNYVTINSRELWWIDQIESIYNISTNRDRFRLHSAAMACTYCIEYKYFSYNYHIGSELRRIPLVEFRINFMPNSLTVCI